MQWISRADSERSDKKDGKRVIKNESLPRSICNSEAAKMSLNPLPILPRLCFLLLLLLLVLKWLRELPCDALSLFHQLYSFPKQRMLLPLQRSPSFHAFLSTWEVCWWGLKLLRARGLRYEHRQENRSSEPLTAEGGLQMLLWIRVLRNPPWVRKYGIAMPVGCGCNGWLGRPALFLKFPHISPKFKSQCSPGYFQMLTVKRSSKGPVQKKSYVRIG